MVRHFGKGFLDGELTTTNGVEDKAYTVWRNMIVRCFCDKYKSKYPTYKDVTVSDKWLNYKNFKAWHNKNYIKGHYLDKDILVRGNKRYSKDFCCYVPCELNSLILDGRSMRGAYPQGVKLEKRNNTFTAQIRKYDKAVHIGTFKTQMAAFNAYKKVKESFIKERANSYFMNNLITEMVYLSLINWKITDDRY